MKKNHDSKFEKSMRQMHQANFVNSYKDKRYAKDGLKSTAGTYNEEEYQKYLKGEAATSNERPTLKKFEVKGKIDLSKFNK